MVRWSDLSTFQGTQLLPKTKNHDLSKRYGDTFFAGCLISCHSFQSQMAGKTWTEDGLRNAVKYMRDVIIGGEAAMLTDQTIERFEDIVSYITFWLSNLFAEASNLLRTCRNTSRWCVHTARGR